MPVLHASESDVARFDFRHCAVEPELRAPPFHSAETTLDRFSFGVYFAANRRAFGTVGTLNAIGMVALTV